LQCSVSLFWDEFNFIFTLFTPHSPDYNSLSLDFHLAVGAHIFKSISQGHPSPEIVLNSAQNPDSAKKLDIETSIGDCRLWIEVLRNISKDLLKNTAILLTESSLGNTTRLLQRGSSVEHETTHDNNQNSLVAFTCGHSFPLLRFQTKIVQEFVEKIQDLPLSTPLTLKHLQLHYKESLRIPSSCPYCVFQYLRKIQLKECPNVPIKPWNPT